MSDPDRITLVAFLIAAATAVVASITLARVRERSRQPLVRGVVLCTAIIVLALTPLMHDTLILRLNTEDGLRRVYIDPSVAQLLLPSVLGLIAFVVMSVRAHRRFRASV